MSKFSERFQILKKESGKTQAAIAEELEMTPQTLSYYANGREPNYDTLCQIADYFHVSTDYLIGRSEIRFNPEQVNASDWQSALLLYINNALNTLFIRYNAYRNTENSLKLDVPFFVAIRAYVHKTLTAHHNLLGHLEKLSEHSLEEIDKFKDEYFRHIITIDFAVKTAGKDFDFFDIWGSLETQLKERIPGYSDYLKKNDEDFLKSIDEGLPLWENVIPSENDIE